MNRPLLTPDSLTGPACRFNQALRDLFKHPEDRSWGSFGGLPGRW